jgi:hypothetical protein
MSQPQPSQQQPGAPAPAPPPLAPPADPAAGAAEASRAVDMAQITVALAALAAQVQLLQSRYNPPPAAVLPALPPAAVDPPAPQLQVPPPASQIGPPPGSRRQSILGINPAEQRAAEGYINEILSRAPEQKVDPIHNYVPDNNSFNRVVSASAMSAIAIDDFGFTLCPAAPGDRTIRLESFLTAAIADAAKSHKTFKTVQDFADALESHRRSAMLKPGVTTSQLSCLQTYITYVLTMCAEHGLTVSQNYHFAVAKHIAAGTHSLYRQDGHYHPAAYAQHVIPAIVTAAHASATAARAPQVPRTNPAAAAPVPKKTNKRTYFNKTSGKYPAGSCKNHPESTSHNTEGCRNK